MSTLTLVSTSAGEAILNTQVSDGLGGAETRAQYFSDVLGGTPGAQKAAFVGCFLFDSLKEGGTYATADQQPPAVGR